MNKQTIYDPNEFQPSESIKSRYANKIVDNRFYGYVKLEDIQAGKAPIKEVASDETSMKFGIRNYEFYKIRNPWMAHNYLKVVIECMEREIKRKYCE